jgi:hypothetical protein
LADRLVNPLFFFFNHNFSKKKKKVACSQKKKSCIDASRRQLQSVIKIRV